MPLYMPEGWRLSPAYDLVPHAQVGYERIQSIIVGKQGREGSLQNALSVAGWFGLTDEKAKDAVDEVREVVSQWRVKLAEDGVGNVDLDMLQTAFLPESAIRG